MMGDLSKELRRTVGAMANHSSAPMSLWQEHSVACLKAADALEWQPIAEVPPGTRRIIGAVNGHVMGDLYQGDHPWARWLTREGAPFSPTHFMPLPEPPEGE